MKRTPTPRRGFSLIELVIVVVIIAIIAAIAIPKMSRAASGAGESALLQDVSQVRSAIDMYTAEHGGNGPSATIATFQNQLLQYSDAAGATFSASRTNACPYGPYLKAFPPLPVGAAKSKSAIGTAIGGTVNGWIWDGTSFSSNTALGENDGAGNPYSGY